jgi:hypothetical protein
MFTLFYYENHFENSISGIQKTVPFTLPRTDPDIEVKPPGIMLLVKELIGGKLYYKIPLSLFS